MKKSRIFALSLLFSLLLGLFASAQAAESTNFTIASGSAILVDANTGNVLYASNADRRSYPASTTKVMTALLAVEAIDRGEISLDDLVTATDASQYDLVWDGSSLGIMPGEEMRLEDLLYCALLASANEACNIIAEYVSGDIASFIELMNRRATELGCQGTHFSNTHGLPDETHYSTAHDLALITLEALKHPIFVRICTSISYEVPATNFSDARYITTTNNLINPEESRYYYSYARGIKTGSTDAAGFCLISSAEKDGISLVSVVLGAEAVPAEDGYYDIQSFSETRRMFEWFFDNHSYREILSSSELLQEVHVEMGDGIDSVIVRPSETLTELLPNTLDVSLEFQREIHIFSEDEGAEPLNAPVETGQILGEIVLTRRGEPYATVPLVANSSVDLSRLEYMKAKVRALLSQSWLKWVLRGVLLIFLLYIAFVIRYNIIRRRRRKRRRDSDGVVRTISKK